MYFAEMILHLINLIHPLPFNFIIFFHFEVFGKQSKCGSGFVFFYVRTNKRYNIFNYAAFLGSNPTVGLSV